MKTAIITDQHFGARADSLIFHDYFEKFYNENFFPYLIENDIKRIFDLGDTFDRRKFINYETWRRCKSYFFDKIAEFRLDYHCLIGNHSTYYKNTNRVNSPQLMLYGYKAFHIYTGPKEVTIDGLKILFVPWLNSENYDETIDLIKETDATVLMGHIEVQGFEMYKGAINDAGLSRKEFRKFDVVLSGHFHHKSTIDNITYLGAPYEITWSDYNDPRGFHIFDHQTKDLTFVRNQCIMFNKVFYDDIDKTESEIMSGDYEYIRDTYVKVIVKNKNNPYVFDLFIDKLNTCEPVNMQVVEDNFNLDIEGEDEILDEAQDTVTIIKKYIKGLNLDNAKPMEDLFYDLYSEALEVE